MIRGRHRGLPVAIDRAVMFPNEFKKDEAMAMADPDTLSVRPNTNLNGEEKSLGGGSYDIRQRTTTIMRKTSLDNDSRTPRPSDEPV